jgi:hypothetical protein
MQPDGVDLSSWDVQRRVLPCRAAQSYRAGLTGSAFVSLRFCKNIARTRAIAAFARCPRLLRLVYSRVRMQQRAWVCTEEDLVHLASAAELADQSAGAQ